MNSLLKPLDKYTAEERGDIPSSDAESVMPYRDDPNDASRAGSSKLIAAKKGANGSDQILVEDEPIVTDEMATSSGVAGSYANGNAHQRTLVKDTNDSVVVGSTITERATSTTSSADEDTRPADETWRTSPMHKAKRAVTSFLVQVRRRLAALYGKISSTLDRAFRTLPQPLQKVLTQIWFFVRAVFLAILSCLNVPLMAIIVSVLVATIPPVKTFFYTPGSFVNNTFTSAINQVGGVAVPIILIVLGGNLCRSTQPQVDKGDEQARRESRNMLICSILSRMLFPLIIMAPLLALVAKFAPVSILDDPIFIIVCFLLTGAPSALQLAQICQVNDVYLPVVARLLVHSYVIW